MNDNLSMFTRMKYVEYLVSTPQNYTCSNLAEHLEDVSHDVVTDYLQRERLTANNLWELAQHLIDDSAESYMIIDDSVQSLALWFYTTLKSNRLVSLDDGVSFIHLDEVEWTAETLASGLTVKLSKIPFAVKLFKLIATNGDIDWVVTNNLDSAITTQVAQQANDVRWDVEQFHRELKQLTGSEKCQCRKQRSQRNHLANCYHAWVTLKAKAREVTETVYAVKHNLLRDYLRAELRAPRIPAFTPA